MLRVGKTVSKHNWGYQLQTFPVAVPPPTPKPISYLQNEMNRTCQQPRPRFAWILLICIIIFTITDQCRYFFTSMIIPDSQTFFDFKQHKYQNLIQKRSTYGPYVAKMFFLQSRQMKVSGCTGVWYKNVETNMCFSIFLL